MKIFIISFIALVSIAVFGDLVNNILRNKYTYVEIFENLLFNSSFMISKIFPISCLLATLFSFNKLKTHSELTAILATGFSSRKIINIICVLSGFIAIIQFINLGYYDPYLKRLKEAKLDGYALSHSFNPNQNIWFKGNDYYGSFLYFDKKDNTLKLPKLYFYDDSILTKIVEAKEARYIKNQLWELLDANVFDLLADKKSFPNYYTSRSIKVYLNEKISDLTKYQSGIYSLNIRALLTFINSVRKTGINISEFLVLYYEKLANSFSCILFALFPLFTLKNSSKRTSSAGKSILMALFFSIFFWVVSSSLQSLGLDNTVPPLVATFSLHALITLYLAKGYFSLEKLT
ncbi:MAG: LptF/LptG family permease [Halobacteriovoraceae bacterium]|nr:LptF/LptG family permease [Halobacteriovoraceae bacterium]